MAKYKALIDLIPLLEAEREQGLYSERDGYGYAVHAESSHRLIEEIVRAFQNANEPVWGDYRRYIDPMMRKYGSREKAPVEEFGENNIMANLVFCWRRDYWNNGSILDDLESGFAIRLLKRLKELDSGEYGQLE